MNYVVESMNIVILWITLQVSVQTQIAYKFGVGVLKGKVMESMNFVNKPLAVDTIVMAN